MSTGFDVSPPEVRRTRGRGWMYQGTRWFTAKVYRAYRSKSHVVNNLRQFMSQHVRKVRRAKTCIKNSPREGGEVMQSDAAERDLRREDLT